MAVCSVEKNGQDVVSSSSTATENVSQVPRVYIVKWSFYLPDLQKDFCYVSMTLWLYD